MSAELEELVCPVCNSEGGDCGHLLARLELDPEAEIDAGAVIEDGWDLPSQLRVVAEEALRTGEPVFLGEAFSAVMDQARNAADEEEGEDPQTIIEPFAPQLAFSLCEQLADRDGVERVETADQIACWAEDPEAVVGQISSEFEELIEELEGLGDAESDDDDEDDEDDDEDEDDEEDEEDE